MRVGIISDIHGNLTAFETVLPAIEKEADRVICLGDVAAVGPQPHETIALLRKLKYPCVMGNTDESLSKRVSEDYAHLGAPEDERRRLEALDRWTTSQISEADREFLSTFKPTVTLRERRSSLFCYHGSPRSNTEGILPTTPDDEVSKTIAGHSATIFAGGHTHSQMVRRVGNSLIINPGSVGLPFFRDKDGRVRNPTWAEYALLDLKDEQLRVELRRVQYALPELARVVRKSGLPDPDWWLADWDG